VKPQAEETHVAAPCTGEGQTVPHAPQLDGSLETSRHALPHLVNPALHTNPHTLELQLEVPCAGAEQTVEQLEQ
jgi:hypothetical protein